ncbi:sigma-54 dependent transcriptional regulator [Halioxenophilus sp. WMMB6]|uniref:sigma-54-dependent transcriptional regulator n=1 Tax=Halioxenophilus sp. WMMB6 TaxID=3073815 RepID=UPI00295EC99F|nr:sigma-54 dependent transcriptional regulator [Halioxenophilus sp. WMMB6]
MFEIDANRQVKLVLAEDDPSLREAIKDSLELAGFTVFDAVDGQKALELVATRGDVNMVVSDVNMPNMDGYQLLQAMRSRFPHVPVLLITAYGTIHQSVKAIQEGAVDYLVKPFEPQMLTELVCRYTAGTGMLDRNQPVAAAQSSKDLLALARRVARTDSTALILGESGTGKEVLARFIHDSSARADKPFVAINCAAIPEAMLESILFGHEKGAYTGAHTAAPGKFEQANGGTLLLDEISEMDIGLQAKLLRVLQEKEVERLGGRKTIPLDVRVIATSNRSMLDEVKAGRFREDLYYRLSVLPLQWLPLRHRREDIVPLAEQLLGKHARKQHRSGVALSDDAKRALAAHDWPGNVRELDNVMQRALILQDGYCITERDLGFDLISPETDNRSALVEPSQLMNDTVVDASLNSTPFSACDSEPVVDLASGFLGQDLKQREFEVIVNTIRQEKGSRKRAAMALGISPRTLRYKIARFRDAGLMVEERL